MRDQERVLSKVQFDPFGGCWLWAGGLRPNGYGASRIGRTNTGAHRASYEAFVGPIPDGMEVLHRCDVKCCVNPNHLFLGSQGDNMQDMHDKSRHHRNAGELNHYSILTDADARWIRANRDHDAHALASSFGVSAAAIRHVWAGRTFKHLEPA